MRTIDQIDVGAISHQLSTPLSIVILHLELMTYYLDDKEKLRAFIKTTSHNVHRLTRNIGNLLDILKIDAGISEAILTSIDVFALFRDICGSVEPYARAMSVGLVDEIPRRGKVMPVDIDKLERILFNLLSNALKCTGAGGKIVVRAEDRRENGILFSVSDTGEGIPEEKVRGIFDPDSAPSGSNEGCGLPLVKMLTQLLGGRISVRSRAGEGSEFTVSLPYIKPSMPTINACGIGLSRKAEIELSDLNLD